MGMKLKQHLELLLQQVGDRLEEGVVTRTFGRKGAGLFILVFKSVMPLYITNLFWIGIGILTCSLFGLYDIPSTSGWQLGSLVVVAIGLWAIYVDLRNMAKGDIHSDVPKS
jgi:hypothetical protein